jgi:hypothetical protein
MGYRSMVGIMLKRDNKDAPSIPTVLALAKTKGILQGDGIGQYWNDTDYGWDDDKFLFYVTDVKWYESYPDVQAMEKLYEFVEELQNESEMQSWYSGMFCRIGENDDDTKQKTFGDDPWGEMWLVRDIGFESTDLLGNQKTESKSAP